MKTNPSEPTPQPGQAEHTQGPWAIKPFDESQIAIFSEHGENPLICVVGIGVNRLHGHANAKLIASAPALAARVKELEAVLEKVVPALEKYADWSNIKANVYAGNWRTESNLRNSILTAARAALGKGGVA